MGWRGLGGRLSPGVWGNEGADAAVTGVEPDVQPLVGRAQRSVGDRLPTEDSGAVVIFVDRVVEPWHGLPREVAQEAFCGSAEHPGSGVIDIGDAALQVEAQGSGGQPLQQVVGGETGLRRIRTWRA